MHIHIHLLIQKERLQSNPTPRKSAQKPNSNKKNISHPRKGQQEVQIPDLLQTNPQALSGLSNPAMLQTSFFGFGGHLQYNQKTQVIYCCFACTTFIVFPNLHDIFFWGDFSNIRTSPNSKTLTPQKQGSVVSIARLQQHSTYRQEGHRTQGLQGLLPT